MARDLRDALRRLWAQPAYSALNVAVLALGLSALLFTLAVVNGLVLRPLPFPEADRLLALGHVREGSMGAGTLSSADVERLRRELRGVDAIGVFGEMTVNLSPGGAALPQRFDGSSLSAGLAEMLGAKPLLGRLFEADDDRPGAALTVLIGERVWREVFAADPAILGRRLIANGESAEIIGVMPADFGFPFQAEAWLPRRLAIDDGFDQQAIARLAPGVGLGEFRLELEQVARRLGAELDGQRRHGRELRATPLALRFVNPTTRGIVWMMFATGVAVLLLACANVATLQLARGLSRGREMAVRSALGAGRASLLRSLLAESFVLALVASAIGLLMAHLGGQWLLSTFIANEDGPAYFIRMDVDARMVGFGFLAALGSCLLAGLLPALRASRADVQAVLRDGDKGSGASFARLARGLVVAEIALTVMLLVGTGMFIRGLNSVLAFDFGTGADPRQIITGRVGLFPQQFPTSAEQLGFFLRVVERLRADPQVAAASVSTVLPGTMGGGHEMLAAEGEASAAGAAVQGMAGHVDEHFIDTYGVRLVAGRGFTAADDADAERVAIIDRRTAEALWPGRDPLGRFLLVNPQRETPERLRVVGVSQPLHFEDADDPVLPTFIVPLRQYPAQFATLAVRVNGGDAESFAPKLAAAVRAEHADTPTYWLRTQQRAIEMGRIGPVILTQVFAAVGLLALLLAATGLYGVLAYAVEQRTRELGIRRAIGAGSAAIATAVGGRLARQVGLGLAIGTLLALPWSLWIANPMLHTRGGDLAVFACVVALIAAVAVLACVAPLRRALRSDPMLALRHD